MNETVITLLLVGDTFMPGMYLKQPGFTYNVCGRKSKETGDTNYIYKKELDKACFKHDMVYGDFKYLTRRAASDKILRDKAFNIAKNPKYDGYKRGLPLWFTYFLIKSLQAVVLISKQIMKN